MSTTSLRGHTLRETINPWEEKQIIPLVRDPEALNSEEHSAAAPPVAACLSLTKQMQEFKSQQAAKTHGLPIIANISPFASSLIYQSDLKSPLKGNPLTRNSINALGDIRSRVTHEPSSLKSLTFEDRVPTPRRTEIHEDMIYQREVRKTEALKTETATIPITTTIGSGQGLLQSSPCQNLPKRKVSESWSMLQNRRMSRRCDEQMSTSTENIATENVRHLKSVKKRIRALVPKANQTLAFQHQNDAIHKGAGKYSARNLADSGRQENQAEDPVTSHMSMSTSHLTALEQVNQQDQSKIASTGAARAAVAESGKKTVETQKRSLPAGGTPRVLPLSLRKPLPDCVPSRRLRNKFKIMRFSGKSPSKPSDRAADVIESDNSRKSSKAFYVMIGRDGNRQDTPTENEKLSAASQASWKAGCSTSTTLVNSDSEGGDTGSRLREDMLNKCVLKCATHGKQIAGSLARWYWKAISPCFDPTSPARKRLDANESNWRDVGLFLVALSSIFILLAVAVRSAQGIAWVIQMVQGLLGRLITILGC
ncbi:hypothetical protein CORC01_09974 [Colletotrichum orchidophilum]|uniref:Uncharacterized protein n=1 Tax=Colletotrichum orchidophilum TaxID=1209926 RepID=A0A1G4B037_9PEZI|nr:uncharacterized protein CORC01_09974 [Colletotrichum orchidophilum]OHE94757.1 hypothetical protein CORC01_09974 [Colletotrichum orchidophilum]